MNCSKQLHQVYILLPLPFAQNMCMMCIRTMWLASYLATVNSTITSDVPHTLYGQSPREGINQREAVTSTAVSQPFFAIVTLQFLFSRALLPPPPPLPPSFALIPFCWNSAFRLPSSVRVSQLYIYVLRPVSAPGEHL